MSVVLASAADANSFRFTEVPSFERGALRVRNGFAVHLGIVPFGSKDYLVALMRPKENKGALFVVPDRSLLQDLAGEDETRKVLGLRLNHTLHCPVTDREYAMLVAHIRVIGVAQN